MPRLGRFRLQSQHKYIYNIYTYIYYTYYTYINTNMKKKPYYYTYIIINSECWIDIWIDEMYIDVE